MPYAILSVGHIAKWLERLTADKQVLVQIRVCPYQNQMYGLDVSQNRNALVLRNLHRQCARVVEVMG